MRNAAAAPRENGTRSFLQSFSFLRLAAIRRTLHFNLLYLFSQIPYLSTISIGRLVELFKIQKEGSVSAVGFGS
jgi:hypothetical protein